MCALGRFFGLGEVVGVCLIAGFFGAPSVLAFLLAPFNFVSGLARQRLTFVVLILMGLPATVLAAVVVHPTLGVFLGLFACALWVPQVALLEEVDAT